MTTKTIELLIELIQCPSVTPDDSGCQTIIGNRLEKLGFELESMPSNGVSNLWARRGSKAPLMVFAGHTDVVPPGDIDCWDHPPFAGKVEDGYVYGRGAADMKGGLAAMVTAIERFIHAQPNHNGSIAMLITSDEEGAAIHGTRHVIERLKQRHETIDYCVLGEPSSRQQLGDTLRNGRRGSLGASLSITGKQGHVAYPHLAENPVHRALPMLSDLINIRWDDGDKFFPPSTLQISNIHAGSGATNVIPGKLKIEFNVRYGPITSTDLVKSQVQALCAQYTLDTEIKWYDSAQPFITSPGTLTEVIKAAIWEETGVKTSLDTGGGTSDGRFIVPYGAQLVEFGPINATIHQVNECVNCRELDQVSTIYESVLHRMLA